MVIRSTLDWGGVLLGLLADPSLVLGWILRVPLEISIGWDVKWECIFSVNMEARERNLYEKLIALCLSRVGRIGLIQQILYAHKNLLHSDRRSPALDVDIKLREGEMIPIRLVRENKKKKDE